ncbi:CPBP family intramembrane metalloprotease [Gramella sp. BOM4]|nr:CPBP family intramembrane metalloprotease [Christiangramia bathymodioli]
MNKKRWRNCHLFLFLIRGLKSRSWLTVTCALKRSSNRNNQNSFIMKKSSTIRVAIFLAILVLMSVLSYIIPGSGNLKMFLTMWVPGIAAILTMLLTGLHLKRLGWRIHLKWIAVGWLLPVAYGAVAYGIIWLTGLGGVPSDTFLERARFTMGMTSENDLLIIISAFFFISLLNLIPNMLLVLGEEIGWRGFLVPELNKMTSFTKTAIFSGLIWFCWHLPGILSGNYGTEGTPLWYQVSCFGLMVISGSFMLAWLRIRSRSVWPAVVFHAVHNGLIQHFFTRLTSDTGNTEYFIGEFGIVLAIVSAGFAAYFIKKSSRKKAEVSENINLEKISV